MKQVSLREFSLQPTRYIKDLPIILTRYNLPIASIVPYVSITVERDIENKEEKE